MSSIDLRSLDVDQLGQVFRDKRAQAGLIQRFERAAVKSDCGMAGCFDPSRYPIWTAGCWRPCRKSRMCKPVWAHELLSDQAGPEADAAFSS
jgi:hypothetical protein